MGDGQAENDALRERSGSIDIQDALTSFFYVLLRDGCPTGEVERALDAMGVNNVQYTNGWLASYAHDVASRVAGKIGRG